MAFMATLNEPHVTRDIYEQVRAEIGWDHDPPAGCLLQAAQGVYQRQTIDLADPRGIDVQGAGHLHALDASLPGGAGHQSQV